MLQSLDTLGAGFQLASHDLDIRGAGNLLGEEQSGHIKEVGFELYQQMLEEAVTSLKAGITEPVADQWSPQISVGTPVLIPEEYVADLSVRLGLYRRVATVEDEQEIESFGAELVDRFGPLPEEVKHLLQIVAIKLLCRRANVERIDTGTEGRGAVVPRQHVRQSGRIAALHRQAGADCQSAAGHEGRISGGLGKAAAAAFRDDRDPAQSGEDRGDREGGLTRRLLHFLTRRFADHAGELLGRLRSRHRIGIVEDEERHALDAGGFRLFDLLRDQREVGIAVEFPGYSAASSPISEAAFTNTFLSDRSAPSEK